VILGVLVAALAAACYDGAYALLALEARRAPARHALRASLFGHLVRRPLWVAGVLLNVVGWPLQLIALAFIPLTVVQPTLALGLLLLLALGSRLLGEHVGPREVVGGLAIVAGVAGIAWAAPERSSRHAGAVPLAIALGALALVALAPYALRRAGWRPGIVSLTASAGAGDIWAAIASKLIVDELSNARWLAALCWGVGAGLAVAAGFLSDMTALQRYEATRVGPVILVMQVAVPVLLAPLLAHEGWHGTPLGGGALLGSLALVTAGAGLLGASRAVGGLLLGSAEPDEGKRELSAGAGQLVPAGAGEDEQRG
jgi:drug/metabolite transporter (DMT)-like permease